MKRIKERGDMAYIAVYLNSNKFAIEFEKW
jgi:hypothetical protein